MWNSENGYENEVDLKMIEEFHHKAMGRIIVITMGNVKDEEINDTEARRRFGGSECVTETWRRRQLLPVSRIVRLSRNKKPSNDFN